ncbi:MAG: methyltransferase domain-containing protein, partial [Candidatus Eisenbacteria bacterium]
MKRRDPSPPRSRPRPTRSLPLSALTAAFVLSGAAGLVYESVWSRYLGLFVGHGAYAQIIVLVIFMGGMAAGALLVARRSERLGDPLALYAWIEGAIGLLGLAFHPAFVAATALAYRSWFPAIGESLALQAVKWGLAALLILPQSVLLGATFPLMAAGVARRAPQKPGRVVALLYFANSLGAAAGGLLAGFWLVRIGGLRGTLAFAAGLNLLVAAVAGTIARRGAGAPLASAAVMASGTQALGRVGLSAWLPRLLVAVSFGTAAASFVYEIAWVRMLSLVLGSATHSFELMLSAFIFGLALGALWIEPRIDGLERPLSGLALTQWVMGALALATLPLYAASFSWMPPLVNGLPKQPHGYALFSIARYGICLAVMLPATFCAGITLPLLTRILLRNGGERAIGTIYGANTLGSILGAALAGLVLLPWLGLERLLATGAALDMALGVLLLLAAGSERVTRRMPTLAAASGTLVIALTLALVHLDPLRLSSGVFRGGRVLTPAQSTVIYYHDGRTATVSVRIQPDGLQTLSTNGKPDASVSAAWLYPDSTRARQPYNDDESTQILLGVLSLAHAPHATRAAVIGIGSGVTSHVLLGSRRLSRVVTIEIEPDMIAAAQLFRRANRRVFDDPRSTLVVDDARSFFAASRERFDLIVSEPSNPWVSGVAGLFTDEFYERMKRSLTPGGVLGQWIHLYSLNDDLVLSVLAAIHRHFRDMSVHMVSSTDCLVLAGDHLRGEDRRVLAEPAIAEDLRPALPITPEQLDATWVADGATLAPLLDRTAPNSDFMPILDLGAERARFRNSLAAGLLRLHADRFGLAAMHAPAMDGPGESRSRAVALQDVPRLAAWSENLHLRATLERRPPVVDTAQARRLFQAVERLHRVRAPGRVDPRVWLRDALLAEQELHSGTSGWVDEAFFADVRRVARLGHAPQPVTLALDWTRALEGRDYPRAATLTDSLMLAWARDRTPWFDPSLLIDGGTTAKLAVGD